MARSPSQSGEGLAPPAGARARRWRPVRWLAALALLFVLGLLLVAWLALDRSPRVAARDDLSPADVDRAVAIVRQHDPRWVRPGQTRWVSLTEREVDLLVHHAARRWLATHTQVSLQPGLLTLQASRPAAAGLWLNLELALRQTTGLPEVDHLHIGRLPVPPSWVLPLLRRAAERQGVQADALLDIQWLERLLLLRGRVVASYRLAPDTLHRLRAALLPPGEHQRLQLYAQRLAAWSQGIKGDSASLAELLPPLLSLAAERSAGSAEPEPEYRAALLTAAAFATRQPLGRWLGASGQWPLPRPLAVTLQQRPDLAMHFLVSAVLAAESGTPLADAVGLWKEMADARRGGSGFSFQDLAADRAGARFGELALRAPQRLQAVLGPQPTEAVLLPPIGDLPELLTEAAYLERYGGTGGAGHQRLAADIDARIAALPLYR